MDDSTARQLLALTGDLMMVMGRMKRHAHISEPGSINPGTEYAILDTVLRHGCKTVPEIASFRGVTRQSVQKLVNKMIEMKTISYSENPSHKSSRYLQVTIGGLKLYKSIEAQMLGRYMDYESQLRPGDVEAAARVMSVIAEVWNQSELEIA
jgi:DNA-binding MarR family transcriptional regulator